MTNKANLHWSRTSEGFEFSVEFNEKKLGPSSWGRYQLTNGDSVVIADALFRECDSEQRPQFLEDKVICSDRFIATLTEIETKQLSLPSVSHAKLKVSAEGLISRPGFKLNYRLLRPEGRPYLGAKLDGAVLKLGAEQQLILDPIYSIIKQIDYFNLVPANDLDERFVRWGEVQELLPEDSIVDGQLSTITICRADRLTLDIREHGAFNPLLIKPSSEKSWDVQSQSDVEYAVPKVKQKEFEQQFKKWNSAKSNYAIGNGTYVVLPERVSKVLSVVKEFQQKPSEERLAFVANPHQYINESLSLDETPEELEAIFVETPEFVSQRIEQIGVWEPKLCAYVVKRDGDWVPDDEMRLFFPIEDMMVNFTLEEMKQLLELIKVALDDELENITFKSQTVPVTLEVKNLLIKMLKPFEDKGEKPDIALAVEAPILKDNIEDVEFEVIKKTPRPLLPQIPQRLKTTSLYEHQKFGLAWLANHWQSGSIGALLADDMGLGKTIQSLTFMAGVKQLMDTNDYPNKPFLIVAPSGLLKNWHDEASIHLHNPGVGELFEAYGPSIRKLKDLNVVERNEKLTSADWVLTTYETLRDKIKYFLSIDWGITIFDEAQKIKNPVSRVTEMAKSLSSDFTLMLTGTPVENELADLWCIVDTAQPGLFGSLSRFHSEYAKPAEADPLEAQRLKELLVERSVPPLMLRRMKVDHIDGLPEKIIKEVPMIMPELQALEYENIVKGVQLEKGNAGAVLKFIQKIRKASLVAEEFDGSGINDGVIKRSARLTSLIKILDEIKNKGEKALVFCETIDVQEYLSGYLQQRYQLEKRPFRINGQVDGNTRKKYVDEFQKGETGQFDVMLLSPKAGGVGLTITAANHVIHLTRWWNPAVEDQSTDRAFRIGQEKPVYVYIPMAIHPKYGEHSFDANLNRLLNKKRNLSLNALLPGTVTDSDFNELYTQTLNG
ncbi:DEAD/DEAH box helicase [Pseudoalteromonas sp. MMG005]|uniref:DEAD/DEAH box helicase n=1 Tax=Pseudoalteromonas sp. MMG005 TaxID=2822682 RepID=UPI001B3A209A|nr:DEAD/DEAH box helicase [Pseudoalteromonas sp. MMG005]MBQ4847923.1 DEAD/DEAH box helicase [Pseudoalteromonas sp. MMG005]